MRYFNLKNTTMKKVLLLLTVITSLTTQAQWKLGYYVDEFGDKTEESYMRMRALGTFSNSATQKSKCVYDFVDSGESMELHVREYGSSMATDTKSTFETVKIKTPSGEVKLIKNVFFSKSGILLFHKDTYAQIKSILMEEGRYVIVFNRSGKYSNSSYKIVIEYQSI
jgi:hypothetical protein